MGITVKFPLKQTANRKCRKLKNAKYCSGATTQQGSGIKMKKRRLAPKTAEGRPLSLATMMGSNAYSPWPATQSGKKTDAVLRNEVEMPEIRNIPSNFQWTDIPILAQEKPTFEGKNHSKHY